MMKKMWMVALIAGTLSASSLQEGLTALQNGDNEKAVKILTPLTQKSETVELVHARHILLKSESEANTLSNTLKGLQGDALKEKFIALAKEKSKGPSAPYGGDLGWFAKGVMVKPFEEAVWSLKPGEVTKKPVKTQFGWHIIYLEGKKQIEEKTVAQRELGRMYLAKENPQASDYEEAERYLTACADTGDKDCQFLLGALYSDALDVLANPMNYINGKNPYKNVGKSIKKKGGADNMYAKAIAYLKDAGDARSYYLLALLYYKGLNMMNVPLVQPDYKEAIKYIKLALKSGDKATVGGLANLYGLLYMEGKGTLQDFTEAEKYFRIAISNGNSLAKCNLGQLYLQQDKRHLAKKYLKEGYEEGQEYCGQIWNENGLGR